MGKTQIWRDDNIKTGLKENRLNCLMPDSCWPARMEAFAVG